MILAESARLFAEFGLSATTIREIADAVDLNSGTLYHYFSSKDAIFAEILVRFLTDLVQRYDVVTAEAGTARHRLSLMVRVSLEVADQHPYATEIYQNEYENLSALPGYAEIAKAVESSHRAWLGVTEVGVRRGEFNSRIDPFEFQRMVRECVFQSVRWHRDTLTSDIEAITATITSVFLDGFAPARTAQAEPTPPPMSEHTPRNRLPAPKPAAEPATDPVGELRCELDELRSGVDAIRELVQSLSDQPQAVDGPAADDRGLAGTATEVAAPAPR
ncbi:TetR/AcrR family transcriptional regulator [Nocardia carnea]|uniref:TetR/AcrR family transcriptional regulator n=1 Tax=Nocardia carnea TaxID=37328 RepID=A0ABW7TSC3_9NOCA|nr:TetR/AcrR family transcriptional regulator [Nocardia carnea]